MGLKDGGKVVCIERIYELNVVRCEVILWKVFEKLDKVVI